MSTSTGLRKGDEIFEILKAWPAKFNNILNSVEAHRLQVLFTQVRKVDGRCEQKRWSYRVDEEYFYPASTIKLCGAIAALEKACKLTEALDVELDIDTPLCFHGLTRDQPSVDQDLSNLDGGHVTLRHEIRKLFLVSDNDAYNQLYTFIGQAELNKRMWAFGFPSCRLTHRLNLPHPDQDDPCLGGRVEVRNGSRPFCLPVTHSQEDLGTRKSVPRVEVGTGYIKDGHLVAGPMDFSRKNYMSLVDLQNMLRALFLPADCTRPLSLPPLSEAHRAFLLEAMLQYPSQSLNPLYDPAKYPDDYCKFFLPGLCRVSPKADWRIFNKVGRAYGFSIDNAYIVHVPSGRSFFLSAVVYTDATGIVNDDVYEYDVADVLMADLAEVLARCALGIPQEQAPLTEPELDCIPSSQWPKHGSVRAATEVLPSKCPEK